MRAGWLQSSGDPISLYMAQSTIEWTESIWNSVTGCDDASPSCENCYARRMAHRLQAMGAYNYRNGFELTLQPQMLDRPLRWRKPQRVFVNSMSDLFHVSSQAQEATQVSKTPAARQAAGVGECVICHAPRPARERASRHERTAAPKRAKRTRPSHSSAHPRRVHSPVIR
jgi:hypothetical protein